MSCSLIQIFSMVKQLHVLIWEVLGIDSHQSVIFNLQHVNKQCNQRVRGQVQRPVNQVVGDATLPCVGGPVELRTRLLHAVSPRLGQYAAPQNTGSRHKGDCTTCKEGNGERKRSKVLLCMKQLVSRNLFFSNPRHVFLRFCGLFCTSS